MYERGFLLLRFCSVGVILLQILAVVNGNDHQNLVTPNLGNHAARHFRTKEIVKRKVPLVKRYLHKGNSYNYKTHGNLIFAEEVVKSNFSRLMI